MMLYFWPVTSISNVFHWPMDIMGKNIVSKRFADKVMSIFSKYQKEELKLIMNCSKMVYYDPYFVGEIYSSQKQYNSSMEAESA